MGVVVALAAVACGDDTNPGGSNNGGGNPPPSGQPDGGSPPPPPTGGTPYIRLGSSPTLGNFLVSASDGRTLYYFGLDVPASGAAQGPTSNCTGSCIAVWPVFHAPALNVDTGLNAADFGEFTRPDGAKQTTFQGWPLYEFSADSRAGDINGDNFIGSGGPWYVVRNPVYSALAMTKNGRPAIYLADSAGRTLYVFAQDTVGTASTPPVSNCTGACLEVWPPFLAVGDVVPTGIDPAKLTTFTRADGTQQSAFDGHPLYFFQSDTLPGQINGQGVAGFSTFDPSTL